MTATAPTIATLQVILSSLKQSGLLSDDFVSVRYALIHANAWNFEWEGSFKYDVPRITEIFYTEALKASIPQRDYKKSKGTDFNLYVAEQRKAAKSHLEKLASGIMPQSQAVVINVFELIFYTLYNYSCDLALFKDASNCIVHTVFR